MRVFFAFIFILIFASGCNLEKFERPVGNNLKRGEIQEEDNDGTEISDEDEMNSEYEVSWTKKWGTDSYDEGNSIAIDKEGNIYVAGFTGNSSGGKADAYLTKLTPEGNIEWKKQWGTEKNEFVFSVAVDNLGNIYVSGMIMGDIDENSDSWFEDVFLTKWNNDGTEEWTKIWGTDGRDINAKAVVDSNGDIFVSGRTTGSFGENINAGEEDLFITKIISDGTIEWTKQWGTEKNDAALVVTIDSKDQIYVAGFTGGVFDGNPVEAGSIFLSKLDNMGNVVFNRQTASDEMDSISSIYVDINGTVFLAGETYASKPGFKNQGNSDVFILIWNIDESVTWMQFGTEDFDCQSSIVLDKEKNIFVSGSTGDAGRYDLFLSKLGTGPDVFWTEYWGEEKDDTALNMAIDSDNSIFISGSVTGSNGFSDFFLTKLEVSE